MRVAEFDREQVLRSAMDEFMSKGFNKTSMQDLKRVTGLHPGSIYCAFENKRDLLIAALEQYTKQRVSEFNAIFAAHPTILAGLEQYMAMVVDECERDEIKDCLLQKALKRHPFYPFHHDVNRILMHATIKHLGDARVIEPRQKLRFIKQRPSAQNVA